jgi:hypothetical protein
MLCFSNPELYWQYYSCRPSKFENNLSLCSATPCPTVPSRQAGLLKHGCQQRSGQQWPAVAGGSWWHWGRLGFISNFLGPTTMKLGPDTTKVTYIPFYFFLLYLYIYVCIFHTFHTFSTHFIHDIPGWISSPKTSPMSPASQVAQWER